MQNLKPGSDFPNSISDLIADNIISFLLIQDYSETTIYETRERTIYQKNPTTLTTNVIIAHCSYTCEAISGRLLRTLNFMNLVGGIYIQTIENPRG